MKLLITSPNEDIARALADALAQHDFAPPVDIHTGLKTGLIVQLQSDAGTFLMDHHYTQKMRAGRILKDLRLATNVTPPQIIHLGAYDLDMVRNELSHAQNTVRLTERERDILAYLSQKSGGVVSKQELLQEIWSYAPDAETHTLETHIYRLRQKIARIGDDNLLETHDNGYGLNY